MNEKEKGEAIIKVIPKNRYGMDFFTIANDFLAFASATAGSAAVRTEEEIYFAIRHEAIKNPGKWFLVPRLRWTTSASEVRISIDINKLIKKGLIEAQNTSTSKKIRLKDLVPADKDPMLKRLYDRYEQTSAKTARKIKEERESVLAEFYEAMEGRKCDLTMPELIIYTNTFFERMYKYSRVAAISLKSFLLLFYMTILPGRTFSDYGRLMPYISQTNFHSDKAKIEGKLLVWERVAAANEKREVLHFNTTEEFKQAAFLTVSNANEWVNRDMLLLPPDEDNFIIGRRENERDIIKALKGIQKQGEAVIRMSL